MKNEDFHLRDFRNYKKSMIIQCMEPNLTYPLDSRSRAPFCVRPSISKIWRHHCTLGEKHVCEFSPPSHCTSAHPRKSSLLQCFKIAHFDVVFILYIHIISSRFWPFQKALFVSFQLGQTFLQCFQVLLVTRLGVNCHLKIFFGCIKLTHAIQDGASIVPCYRASEILVLVML